ncbi:hypothetical protein AB0P21_10070 [Kribbella sp. NPDC056861]|uniref:hypothetical protein n=1 Tax=Kribbella sp. NPDC056861 TaxID=3154857 RepID=UPI003423052E
MNGIDPTSARLPELSSSDVAELICALAALQPVIEQVSWGWAEEMRQAVEKALTLTTITPIIAGEQYVHVGPFRPPCCRHGLGEQS